MREIKFRVWSESEQRYLYGLSRYLFGSDDNEKCTLYIPQDFKAIFEQYTGLKDKNGKEIYEGDIVQIDDHILGDFEVVWHGLGWKIKRSVGFETLSVHKSEDIVVIGNIHENPELLEGEK